MDVFSASVVVVERRQQRVRQEAHRRGLRSADPQVPIAETSGQLSSFSATTILNHRVACTIDISNFHSFKSHLNVSQYMSEALGLRLR